MNECTLAYIAVLDSSKWIAKIKKKITGQSLWILIYLDSGTTVDMVRFLFSSLILMTDTKIYTMILGPTSL